MFASSERFLRMQQQFKECTSFEQLCAMVELIPSLQISYQYFFMQLLQINVQNGNDVMFNHTVDDANSPDIVTCLLSNTLDKILITLQLYLPLISIRTLNEKLLNAYRDVLTHLDKNLSANKCSYTEEKLINLVRQIVFFIQINPSLQVLLTHIPRLIYLIETKSFHPEPRPLQRMASNRSPPQPLMTFSSENTATIQAPQQLTRRDTDDSGVDLTDPSMHNLLSKNAFFDRNSMALQKQHLFVEKTASSPIPEHTTMDGPARVPLHGVLSAPPATSNHSNLRQRSSMYHQLKHVSTLAKSDEEEEDEQESSNQTQTSNPPSENPKQFGQFHSLRYRNPKSTNIDNVSPYLGVDTNAAPMYGTFAQSNTGMKDVPRWLKHLRLHKYTDCFAHMTFDEMMNLTSEQLRALDITAGACTKIVSNIDKLKKRSTVLKQFLIDLDNEQIDLSTIIPQLNEVMMTPIHPKPLFNENPNEEELPKLIIDVLEKILQKLPAQAPWEMYINLLKLVDCCYKHEAFNEYTHSLLQWRRRLSTASQPLAKVDLKANQPAFGHPFQQRRSIKPSVRPMMSSSAVYHQNYLSNSVPLSKYNSEPQNNQFFDPNLIRRPNRSSTLAYPTNEEANPAINQGAYLANHQHQALTRKASIDPHSENNYNNNNRAKLCKTHSDPHRMRVPNLSQTNYMQSANRPQQSLIRMVSSPYSQQQRPFISRSPPTPTMDTLTVSPIKKCYSDNENSEYYDNHDSTISFSNLNDTENSDEQRRSNADLELISRQVTESAISDDVPDPSMDDKEDSSNNQLPSTDMEQ